MSIIDDTLKRLGDEQSRRKAATFAHEAAVPPVTGPGSGAGTGRRRPLLLPLFMVVAVAGVLVFIWQTGAHSPSIPAAPRSEPRVAVLEPVKPLTDPPPAAPAPARLMVVDPVTPVPPSAVAAPAVNVAVAPDQAVAAATEPQEANLQPSWYTLGWSAARKRKWPDAFTAWEDGVRGLPRDRMMIAGNSYAELNAFSAAIRRYVKSFPVIGVRQQRNNGQMVYRLVVFPFDGGTRKVLPRVKKVFPRAGMVNASFMQAHMVGARDATAARQEVAKAGDDAGIRAGKGENTPLRMPVEAADVPQPAADEKAHLFTASRMLDGNMDSAVDVAAVAAPAEKAKLWNKQSRAVRELLKAEAYSEIAIKAQELTRDFPGRWESWFWLGTAQLAQGQVDAAGATLERAGKVNPKVAQVWVLRAVVAQEYGDHALAVRLLKEARKLSPDSPQIYLNLGYSDDALGLFAEAEKNYRYYMALTEGDTSYLLQRTLVIERLERKHPDAD